MSTQWLVLPKLKAEASQGASETAVTIVCSQNWGSSRGSLLELEPKQFEGKLFQRP